MQRPSRLLPTTNFYRCKKLIQDIISYQKINIAGQNKPATL